MDWSLTFEDIQTVHSRLRMGGFYRMGSDDPTPGRLLYLASVGLAVRRAGKKLIVSSLVKYGAEWFGVPVSDLWDSIEAAANHAGFHDMAAMWEWLTMPSKGGRNEK